MIIILMIVIALSPRDVLAKVLDTVSEFTLEFLYYVHFRINTIGKAKNLLQLWVK